MGPLVTQEILLNPVGQYRYYYDPVTATLYYYRYDPFRRVYVLTFATGWVTAPKKVEVKYTQKLRIIVSFYYSGPAFEGVLYGAIGSRTVLGIFDEILKATSPLKLSETPTATLMEASVDIDITTAIAPGDYSIYAKIQDAAGNDLVISNYLEGAVRVIEVRPEFTEFTIKDWKVV